MTNTLLFKRYAPFLWVCLSALFCAQHAIAQSAGAPDTGFGDGGKVVRPLGRSDDDMRSVALQPDGKIVAAGYAETSLGTYGFVLRLLPDGTPDAAFGQKGYYWLPERSGFYVVKIQPDGKIVAGGYVYGNFNFPAILRLLPDGKPDNSFGSDGLVSFSGQPYGYLLDLTLQPDGNILGAGANQTASDLNTTNSLLLRLNPNGVLDAGFGNNGRVIYSAGTGSDHLYGIHTTPDGKILGAGFAVSGAERRAVALRFNPNGLIDTAYGTAGVAKITVANAVTHAFTSCLQPDGKLLLGGYAGVNPNRDFMLARLLDDGQPDPAFGVDGISLIPSAGQTEAVRGLAVWPDGSIAGAGYTAPDNYVAVLLRWKADGTPDPAFGGIGAKTLDWPGYEQTAWSICLQPDGKWLVAGYLAVFEENDIALARFDADGVPDASFADSGLLMRDLAKGIDYSTETEIAGNGDMYSLASGWTGYKFDMFLMKYLPDGSPDTGFGDNGVVTDVFSAPLRGEYAAEIAFQANGKILVSGDFNNAGDSLGIWRLHADGSPDLSFAGDGEFSLDIDDAYLINLFELIALPDGKILYGGGYVQSSTGDRKMFVGRLLPDGAPDPAWGDNGLLVLQNLYGEISDMKVLPDGKLILAGSGNIDDYFIARLDKNGNFDPDYASGGYFIGDINNTSDMIVDLSLRPDGSVLAAALVYSVNSSFIAIMRFLPNGVLDPSFGDNGIKLLNTGALPDIFVNRYKNLSLAVQADGKILATCPGWTAASSDILVFRLLPNGQNDALFGTNGRVTIDVQDYWDISSHVVVQPDQKIVVTGQTSDGASFDFLLLRILPGLVVGASDFNTDPNVLLVYPNPVKEAATLRYENPADGTVQIDLLDMQGKIMQTFSSGRQFAGEREEALHFLPGLPAGHYVCRITTEKGIAAVRLVKAD